MPRRQTAAEYQKRLLLAQQLVQDSMDEAIDPALLAKAARFSLHHFHRIFRAQMGETVMQYVRRLRLERAARKLRSSDARILDLALEAGYESHEAFTRAFVERYGISPSRFREQPYQSPAAWNANHVRTPNVPVRVQTCAELRVAFMRHRGSYARVGETWQKLTAWASSQGLLGGKPVLYGICPDDPEVTEEAFLRFDACVAVDRAFKDDAVGMGAIPGGTYAVAVHHGPYDRLHETYLEIIGRWFPQSGYELAADAVIEHYLNDPSQTRPDDLRTEVRVRIAE